jgi:hypothetical protein
VARITEWGALAALGLLLSHSVLAATPSDYAVSVEQARSTRIEQLKQMDGYLALTASGWLEPGANSVGSTADNRFAIPGAPAHLGVLELAASGQVSLHLPDTRGITVDGAPAATDNLLRTQGADGKQKPTRVGFGSS